MKSVSIIVEHEITLPHFHVMDMRFDHPVCSYFNQRDAETMRDRMNTQARAEVGHSICAIKIGSITYKPDGSVIRT